MKEDPSAQASVDGLLLRVGKRDGAGGGGSEKNRRVTRMGNLRVRAIGGGVSPARGVAKGKIVDVRTDAMIRRQERALVEITHYSRVPKGSS